MGASTDTLVWDPADGALLHKFEFKAFMPRYGSINAVRAFRSGAGRNCVALGFASTGEGYLEVWRLGMAPGTVPLPPSRLAK
jgi:hypothetical protein